MFSPAQMQAIANGLASKGCNPNCSACGRSNYAVEALEIVNVNVPPGTFGGPAVPAVLLSCPNCGHIRRHALGAVAPTVMKELEKQFGLDANGPPDRPAG